MQNDLLAGGEFAAQHVARIAPPPLKAFVGDIDVHDRQQVPLESCRLGDSPDVTHAEPVQFGCLHKGHKRGRPPIHDHADVGGQVTLPPSAIHAVAALAGAQRHADRTCAAAALVD